MTIFLFYLFVNLRAVTAQDDIDPDRPNHSSPPPPNELKPIVIAILIVLVILVVFGGFLIFWFCIKKKAPKEELSIDSINDSPISPKEKKNKNAQSPVTTKEIGTGATAPSGPPTASPKGEMKQTTTSPKPTQTAGSPQQPVLAVN